MKKITDLLERARKLTITAEAERRAGREAIKEIIGLELKLADLTCRGRTLFVRASPAVKSELLLKQREVLGRLKEILGPNPIIREIR